MRTDIGHLIKILSERLRARGDEHLKKYDLTTVQMHVMWFVHMHDGAVSQKEIEQFLQVSHPTVTGLISRMEKKGFLTSGINPQDKRSRLIRTTEKSNRVRDGAIRHKAEMERTIRQGLSAEEISELQRMLLVIYRNLGGTEEDCCVFLRPGESSVHPAAVQKRLTNKKGSEDNL